jgi:enamine deaminase RidA (YjgF/YER057c/UK114 family)
MSITRHGTTARWSDIVIHNRTAYLVEVANDPRGDLEDQTRQVLAQLQATLARAGSDPSRLLTVTVWLRDIGEIAVFNRLWDAWIPAGHAPSRACVQAALAHPDYRVELQVTAATD